MPTPTQTPAFHPLRTGDSGFEATVAAALGHDVDPDSPLACQMGSDAIAELRAVGVTVRVAARIDQPPGPPACAALVESPGATALLTGCWESFFSRQPSNASEAIASCCRTAFEHGSRLVEILLPPAHYPASKMAADSGATHLTTLLYLRRCVATFEFSNSCAESLTWRSYTPHDHELFLAAIQRSYAQSMDCPELTLLRTAEETLAGHRAAGPFDPSLWWVVVRGNEPIGVLLLCEIPRERGLELVYVGVAQAVRGTGVADAMIDRALGLARARGAKFVALAVDARNIPARRLYARLRFVEIGAKEVWIALPDARHVRAASLVRAGDSVVSAFHAM